MKSITQDGNIGIKEGSRALKEEGVLQRSCWQYKLQVWQNQGSESSQGAGPPGSPLLTHRQTALPTHLPSSLHPCPPQRGGLHCPPTPTRTPFLSSLFLFSTPSFSAAWIHPTWPRAEIFTLNTMSALKKSQIWVELRLGCSSCIWRQLVHPSKVHDGSESKLALPSTWENFQRNVFSWPSYVWKSRRLRELWSWKAEWLFAP